MRAYLWMRCEPVSDRPGHKPAHACFGLVDDKYIPNARTLGLGGIGEAWGVVGLGLSEPCNGREEAEDPPVDGVKALDRDALGVLVCIGLCSPLLIVCGSGFICQDLQHI
jgi:hypothetical protein